MPSCSKYSKNQNGIKSKNSDGIKFYKKFKKYF